jgi:peptidoglycan/xylan/chitin deacetylase (PgdA/CDA1 family)
VARWLDVLVLCYHGVHPAPRHGEVTPDALRDQLALVAKRGYRFTTFVEAVTRDVGGRVAAVTFDDGIASAIEFGEPVLQEAGASGTMFLTLETLGVGGRLTESDAAALAARGWEVGSHTMSHPTLTKVDDLTLAAELGRSKEAIERLTGNECLSVAYPKGRADARVVSAARTAGYRAGAALEGGTDLGTVVLAWPRVGVRGDDSLRVFGLKCSRTVRWARSGWVRRPVAAVATRAGSMRRRLRGPA